MAREFGIHVVNSLCERWVRDNSPNGVPNILLGGSWNRSDGWNTTFYENLIDDILDNACEQWVLYD
jgi:hypothetical protein